MNAQTAGNLLLWLAAIPAVGSVVVYSWVQWWRSPWGRHLMSYMAAVSIPLVLGCARQIIGDSPAFQALRTAAFGLVVIVLWWRFALTLTAFREGPPDEDEPDEDDLSKRRTPREGTGG